MTEQEAEVSALDAELLGDLAPRTVVVGLSGRAHPAREHVVRAGMDVLRGRPTMDQDVAGAVAHQDVRVDRAIALIDRIAEQIEAAKDVVDTP
jgi:hypothetical protein